MKAYQVKFNDMPFTICASTRNLQRGFLIVWSLGKSASAVKMRLQKGRRLLKEIYQKEYM